MVHDDRIGGIRHTNIHIERTLKLPLVLSGRSNKVNCNIIHQLDQHKLFHPAVKYRPSGDGNKWCLFIKVPTIWAILHHE